VAELKYESAVPRLERELVNRGDITACANPRSALARAVVAKAKRKLAESLLDCGNDVLQDAAKRRATARGTEVLEVPRDRRGSAGRKWGDW
jgi:hypothetical protein